MNPPKVPPSAHTSKPVPTESQAIVEGARRRTAPRKARSAVTLAQHKQSRTAHKAHSRSLVDDAGRRSLTALSSPGTNARRMLSVTLNPGITTA